jgi:hypothetical protein
MPALSDAEKHCINLVAQETDQDATGLFFTDKEEFNRLLRAALGVPEWRVKYQRLSEDVRAIIQIMAQVWKSEIDLESDEEGLRVATEIYMDDPKFFCHKAARHALSGVFDKHLLALIYKVFRTDEDATTLFFTNTEEFNRLLRALGVVLPSEQKCEIPFCERPSVNQWCCKSICALCLDKTTTKTTTLFYGFASTTITHKCPFCRKSLSII